MRDGHTTAPNLLTEADLVALMDRNGIGTDATIAEHIHKIIEREYVFKQREGRTEYLVPSTLGIALVKGYDQIGFDQSLSKPHLRRETERRMAMICDGQTSKADVLNQTLMEYRDVFARTSRGFQTIIDTCRHYLEGDGGAGAAQQGDRDDDDEDDHPPAPQGGGRGRGRGNGRGRGARRGRGSRAAPVQQPRDDFDDDEDDAPPPPRAPPARRAPPAARARNDDDETTEAPQCQCSEPAVERTVMKEGPNKGKRFFTCAKGKDSGCGFFQWSDQSAAPARSVPQKRDRPFTAVTNVR